MQIQESRIVQLETELARMKQLFTELLVLYNTHIHVENTASSYTQNANTSAITSTYQLNKKV